MLRIRVMPGLKRCERHNMSSVQEPAGLEPLELASALFEEKKYGACLKLLDAAVRASTLPGIPPQQLKAQTLICSIHLYAERGAWWQVTVLAVASVPERLVKDIR